MGFMTGAMASEVGPGMSAASTIGGSSIMTPPDSLPLPTIAQAPQVASVAPTSPTIASGPPQAAPQRMASYAPRETVQPQAPTRMTIAAPSAAAPSNDQAAQVFDQRFKGTPLEGKWDVVSDAAKQHGIPPHLAASVMALESGNGKHISGNNPGGLMDPKTPNMTGKQSFKSVDAGIRATTAVIAKNYDRAGGDLGRLAQIYAPVGAKNDPNGTNKDWLPSVSAIMRTFR